MVDIININTVSIVGRELAACDVGRPGTVQGILQHAGILAVHDERTLSHEVAVQAVLDQQTVRTSSSVQRVRGVATLNAVSYVIRVFAEVGILSVYEVLAGDNVFTSVDFRRVSSDFDISTISDIQDMLRIGRIL